MFRFLRIQRQILQICFFIFHPALEKPPQGKRQGEGDFSPSKWSPLNCKSTPLTCPVIGNPQVLSVT